MRATMPKMCFLRGCRSGYNGTDEKMSRFCLPADAEQRERRVIPRQEGGGFTFPGISSCVGRILKPQTLLERESAS